MIKRLEAKIFGRVQLVMYRDFARREAREIGLTGFVRNVEDGSVEVLAEGEEEKLNAFLERLKVGPLLAKVLRIEQKWVKPSGEFSEFFIKYD